MSTNPLLDAVEFELLDVIDYFEHLDELRDSGSINMFGAARNMMENFPLTRDEAQKILKAWMDTFDSNTTAEDRAYQALGME